METGKGGEDSELRYDSICIIISIMIIEWLGGRAGLGWAEFDCLKIEWLRCRS